MVPYSTKMSETNRWMGGGGNEKRWLVKKRNPQPRSWDSPHPTQQYSRWGSQTRMQPAHPDWTASAGCFREEAWTHSPPHSSLCPFTHNTLVLRETLPSLVRPQNNSKCRWERTRICMFIKCRPDPSQQKYGWSKKDTTICQASCSQGLQMNTRAVFVSDILWIHILHLTTADQNRPSSLPNISTRSKIHQPRNWQFSKSGPNTSYSRKHHWKYAPGSTLTFLHQKELSSSKKWLHPGLRQSRYEWAGISHYDAK